MKIEEELASAANLNFVGSYRKLAELTPGGAARDFGPVFAFVTGIPVPLFNGCIVAAPATPADLEAAVAWVGAQGFPYQVFVDEGAAPGLDRVVTALGLCRNARPHPNMVLYPIPEPPEPAPGVTVRGVATQVELGEHHEIWRQGGIPLDLAQRMFPSALLADPDARLFTACLEGEPVGTSLAIRTGSVAGVYAVGTLELTRRHGVATAAAWAAVNAGREWRSDVSVLQASEMGFPVYTAMGFRTVVSYATFTVQAEGGPPRDC